jgi:hypothetical protein
MAKTKISNEAARRIQSAEDVKGETKGFKARAASKADKNNKNRE